METLIFLVTAYCFFKIVWVLIEGLKIWLHYTNTPEGYRAALQEFKEHCEAKERLKHDSNFKLKLDL